MSGASQTQNVQRGIMMVFFLNFALLTLYVIIKFFKKRVDSAAEGQNCNQQKTYNYKQNQISNKQQSSQKMENGFDKVAVHRQELGEDATCFERFLHRIQQFVHYYSPFLILLPLNILTGTSKAFSLALYFIIAVFIFLFNIGKVHRKCGDSKYLNVFLQNLWLLLCFFFCVNQWAATPISMPYIVV